MNFPPDGSIFWTIPLALWSKTCVFVWPDCEENWNFKNQDRWCFWSKRSVLYINRKAKSSRSQSWTYFLFFAEKLTKLFERNTWSRFSMLFSLRDEKVVVIGGKKAREDRVVTYFPHSMQTRIFFLSGSNLYTKRKIAVGGLYNISSLFPSSASRCAIRI